ncbi:MAG: hypothetical protein sL5_08190 [Candidatus Mesenet longicola]|uniref:Uncharacterized protein n=1 Tax=Candidatus Mesenet longicola TaxID=1892558 RepID=A0A8J3HQ71_9RICK|nr:MAG: hypothetical protein sGL2_08860 [Candidatus Mesenet longicola]GHM59826.1 MAG: hypothetical protein sL5_08190 [Candidatus Mesenet longicola]
MFFIRYNLDLDKEEKVIELLGYYNFRIETGNVIDEDEILNHCVYIYEDGANDTV